MQKRSGKRRTYLMKKLKTFYLIKHTVIFSDPREKPYDVYGYYLSDEDLHYGDQVSVDSYPFPYGWVVGCLICSLNTFKKQHPGYITIQKCKKVREKDDKHQQCCPGW